jgi:hypothetical protein
MPSGIGLHTECDQEIQPTWCQPRILHCVSVVDAHGYFDLDCLIATTCVDTDGPATAPGYIFQSYPKVHAHVLRTSLLSCILEPRAKHVEDAVEIKRCVAVELETIEVGPGIVIGRPLIRVAESPIGLFDLLESIGVATFVGVMLAGQLTISPLDIVS